MKRAGLSAAVLAVLVAVLSWNAVHLGQTVAPLTAELGLASEAVRMGDWAGAQERLDAVQARWAAERRYLHLVQCHDAVGEIAARLEEAEAYLAARDAGACRAALAQAVGRMGTLCEGEGLTLGNLL